MTNEMTAEEAIEVFKSELDWAEQNRYPYISENKVKANKLAINALEQQPTLDTRQRERQLEMEYQKGYDKGWEEGRKALEAQPTDKCKGCYYNDGEAHAECVVCDKGAQPTETINREDAIGVILKYFTERERAGRYSFTPNLIKQICADLLSELPPVTPQRPKGKWIKYKSRFGVYFKCSECGKKLNWIDRDDNYCNNCGSDNSESTKEWFKEWDTSIAEMSGGGEDADSN